MVEDSMAAAANGKATNGTNGVASPEKLWTPSWSTERNMDKFRLFINERFAIDLRDYHDLYTWSVTKIADFWESVWIWSKIKHSRSYEKVVEDAPMQKIPKWFLGARLNFAENLLPYNDEHLAIIATGEYGRTEKLTYSELRERVRVFAGALRAAGIGVGDRVCAYIPNCVEAIVGMLAATSLGAVWSSTSPDFGVAGVLERFSQVKPKVLITVNAIVYNSKHYDHLDKVRHVVDGLTELSRVVVVPFVEGKSTDLSGIKGATWLPDFLATSDDGPLIFEQLPPDQPVYIMYSSGTTGLPKCMVHSALGTLIKHKTEQTIHSSLQRNDVLFYYTTTGWMMWNWLVSGLATGLTVFLYDGSPFKPHPGRLMDLVDEHGITVFGTSAKYLQSLQEVGAIPRESHSLASLHTILSTGSPLRPESYDFVYRDMKKDVLLGSISGGTDIVSCFVGQNDTLPVYKGEIQCRLLGMAIEAWDINGHPVLDEEGDMVCVKPFPCMPVAFWNDTPERLKYMAAYFDQFSGVWYHGDFLRINSKTGGVVLLGRSDGTLNPGGVRFGSAEIYHIMSRFLPEIADTLCVGQRQGADERVVLFCQMAPGHKLTDALRSRIARAIRDELSPRHVPAKILPIADIPHTINGKKVEVAVKKIISGATVVPSGTLANPECLELYKNIPELQV
ncbi:acetoacetate-CoA ligase [Gonapodya prolifera JEL478]|uniref:Acetoacetate-CoA ligase n=1 Tax=Gonapodya prolifera (strain JEL478) TaxID=1344416 RepID=A0A139AHW3_GONPJ|nr:acetoacetate-CoA ligase [Gonapodya prolifera JEL478]|eukprot:KXS16134.1 acetoacetate-CoA ligase [Gonapodya prolifera JEL478]